MKRTLVALLAGASTLAAAGAASAQQFQFPFPFGGQPQQQQQQQQPYGNQGGASITFYEGENFNGRAVTVFGEENNFSDIGFNDRARSARANGSFVVCEDIEFRGRCERITGAIRDLNQLGFSGRISSARDERGGGSYGDRDDDYGDRDDDRRGGRGAYGNPRRDGVQGRTVTFFARPNVGGNDVAGRGQTAADQFCRASGFGGAVYYSQGERSRRAVDQDGRIVDAPVLRDVLCRNR